MTDQSRSCFSAIPRTVSCSELVNRPVGARVLERAASHRQYPGSAADHAGTIPWRRRPIRYFGNKPSNALRIVFRVARLPCNLPNAFLVNPMRRPDELVLVHLYHLLFLPASCTSFSSTNPRKQRLTGGSLLLDQTRFRWAPFTLAKSAASLSTIVLQRLMSSDVGASLFYWSLTSSLVLPIVAITEAVILHRQVVADRPS